MNTVPILPASQPSMRPPGEDLWYCPARDISALTPEIIFKAFKLMDQEQDEYRHWLNFVLKDTITDECLCQVASALASMTGEEMLLSKQSFESALKSSGLLDAPVAARLLVFAGMGELLLSAYWDGIRTATTAKPGETLRIRQTNPKELAAEADRLVRYLRLTPRQRRWSRLAEKIEKWLQAVHIRLIGGKG